jgi:hypothetical protein
MKKAKVILSTAVLATFLFTAIFIISSANAQPPRSGHGFQQKAKFEVNQTIKDNLLRHKGKEVVVHLNSGKTLQGQVEAVGTHLLHLEKLAGGRDYYDALIRIQDISAIEARVRGDR